MTSTRSDLTSRFQRRLVSERAEIEATAARELKVLGESLRGVAQARSVPSKPIRGVEREIPRDVPARVAVAPGVRPDALSRYLRRELGRDVLAVDDHRAADRDAGGAPGGHRASPPTLALVEQTT